MRTWSGWSLGGYVFLNDATCEDGAFEVAIGKPPAEPGGEWWQVESVTFGWLTSPLVLAQRFRETGRRWTPDEIALEHISDAISGKDDPGQPGSVAWEIDPLSIETPEQHGRCRLCA